MHRRNTWLDLCFTIVQLKRSYHAHFAFLCRKNFQSYVTSDEFTLICFSVLFFTPLSYSSFNPSIPFIYIYVQISAASVNKIFVIFNHNKRSFPLLYSTKFVGYTVIRCVRVYVHTGTHTHKHFYMLLRYSIRRADVFFFFLRFVVIIIGL